VKGDALLKRSRVILTVIVLLVVTNLVTYSLATGMVPWLGLRWGAGLFRPGSDADFARLYHQYRVLMTKYVDELDGHELIEGALHGMADAVGDPYTYYMDPQEYEEFDLPLSGEYVGVGMTVEQVGDYVTVVLPFPDSPAERAGLRPRDRIVGVDGKDVVGVPLDIVARLIRGEEGTPVVLTVLRGEGEAEVRFDVTLIRERIVIQSAKGKMLYPDEGLGYIQITDFSRKTPGQFDTALAELRAQGLKGLVLDLRNNGGGYLDECVTIARRFIAEGTILYRVGRDGEPRPVEAAGGEGIGVPVVVLINEWTASAAEILAGAIRDNGVGVLVGVTSFGKGTVQTPFDMGGGSVLRLTTERWLRPNKEQIADEGIEPDTVVSLPVVDETESASFWEGFTWSDPEDPRDTQLRRAVELLRQALGEDGGS